MHLQRAQEVDQVPGVVGLNVIGKRWHGSAVETGHEDSIEIRVRRTALEAGITFAAAEIVRTDRLILTVGQGCSRGPISLALWAVTLPAFHLRKQCFAMCDAFHGDRGLGRNFDRLTRLFFLPTWREDLDVSNQVGP